MIWSKDSKHRNCLISISSPLVSYNQNIFHQNWDYTEKFTIIKVINTWVLSVIKILNQGPLNHLLYHYQQRQIPQPSGIVQIGVHQPPLHNNQALPLHFLLMINANPNLIWVVVKHAGYRPSISWQPQANHVVLSNNTTLTWLLDSGESHHVTPYQGSDDIMISDGLTLPITHTSSTTIPTSSRTFTLENVKDINTRAILLMGEPKDGVYEWPTTFPSVTSSSLLAFSSIKTTLSEWHSRLDNGGEYQALDNFLSNNGISHLTTPPHTLEHNGLSERRYRHIVEIGLSLLTHASMPLTFWTYAFATVVYLINRMPTPTLHLSSPFDKLFESPPNYTKLRVFGCLCYPWLCLYSQHKLDSRSTPCIFLGYSSTQSAYICLDLSTFKTYISRHIKFLENSFPLTTHQSHLARPTPELISNWLPQDSSCQHPFQNAQPIDRPFSPIDRLSLEPHNSETSSASTTTPPTHQNTHPMTTIAKNNIHKPLTKMNLTVVLSQPSDIEPHTVNQTLIDPKWKQAMNDEFDALVRNGTWELVPFTSM
ncbi:hypothetical protein AAG906_004781 [Vitis piasezkii]